MKKISICLVLAAIAIFTACNSDNNIQSNVESPVVGSVRKLTETVYQNGASNTSIVNFNYNGSVLKNIALGTSTLEFAYDGDKIVESKSYNNGVFYKSNALTYNGLLLQKIVQNSGDEKTEFDYTNGILSAKKTFFANGSSWTPLQSINYVIAANGNISESTLTSYTNGTNTYRQRFEYDLKSHVFKKMNPYLRFVLTAESFDSLSTNNILKAFIYTSATTSVQSHNNIILYNSSDFPIAIKKYYVLNGSNILVSECAIEYN